MTDSTKIRVTCRPTKKNARGNATEWTATCHDCEVSVRHVAQAPTMSKLRREHLDKKHPGHLFGDF